MMTFDDAFKRLIGHEGDYICHPADPGGETRFGISKRAYPDEDIKRMTLDRAKFLYRRDYWTPAGCDRVPEHVRFDLFDMAVNSGPTAAISCLQGAAGAVRDGVLGPKTIAAIDAMPPHQVLARFNGTRLAFMAALPIWPTFGRGWANRIASNLMNI